MYIFRKLPCEKKYRRDCEVGKNLPDFEDFNPVGRRRYLSGSSLKVFSSCSGIAPEPSLQSVQSSEQGQALCLLHRMIDTRRWSVILHSPKRVR
jgi:hypothetical protein